MLFPSQSYKHSFPWYEENLKIHESVEAICLISCSALSTFWFSQNIATSRSTEESIFTVLPISWLCIVCVFSNLNYTFKDLKNTSSKYTTSFF